MRIIIPTNVPPKRVIPTHKTCGNCGETKPAGSFYKTLDRKIGLIAVCKKCKLQKYGEKANAKRRTPEFRDKERIRRREYLARPEVRERTRKRVNARVNSSWKYILANRIGSSMRAELKGIKKGIAWKDLVGYGTEELKAHLEKQFKKGMSWDNAHLWHIDHIVPISSFHITGPFDPDIKVCWGLANLRPIWREENQSKHAKRTFLL